MCETPSEVPTPTPPYSAFVACHKCWQCRLNRVHDLVGRCIAESLHADDTISWCGTYGGGDTPESAVLFYPHFQNFIKRLRKDGYKVRYIVAGEYGGDKGRAHWHAILFFRGKSPNKVQPHTVKRSMLKTADPAVGLLPIKDIVFEERFAWQYWEHGVSFIEKPQYGAFAYALKYALKGIDEVTRVGHLAMSKKPPLGDTYVQAWAQAHVDQGLPISSFVYRFGDVFDTKGKRREFYLQGKSQENLLTYFAQKWEDQRGTPLPYSERMEEYEDRLVREEQAQDAAWDDLLADLAHKATIGWRLDHEQDGTFERIRNNGQET